MQIAVEHRGGGYAWRLADVERNPNQYDWRVVIGTDREGPICHRGGPGINGRFVVVRDINHADRETITAYVQHIRNATIARDRESEQQLRRQLDHHIAAHLTPLRGR